MKNPLIWLSGAQPDILRETSDHGRYLGIGSAVLITSGIATMSMTFALHTALKINLAGAIFCSVLWGLAIMSIDRWLVVSLQRQDGKLTYGLLVLVRLSLGLLFGLIISTPVVLQVFSPEINKEIVLIQRQAANAYYTSQRTSALNKKVIADQAAVSALERTINSSGGTAPDPYQNPQVKALVQQRNQEERQAAADYNQWQCQLYGIPRGACRPGNGPLAMASHTRYINDERLVSQYDGQITTLVRQLRSSASLSSQKIVATAKVGLPAARDQLTADRAEQDRLLSAFKTQNANTAGLLLRLQALGEATGNDGVLRLARWLLFLLFTTIECLPILVKTLLNLGPENTYEKLVAMRDAKRLRSAKERVRREQAAEIIGIDDIIDQANQLAEDRKDAYPEIRRMIIAAERDIAVKMVQEWQAREERFITESSGWHRAARMLLQRPGRRAGTRLRQDY